MNTSKTTANKRRPESCIFRSNVHHSRFAPTRHAFRYRLWYLFLDIDDLPQINSRFRLLGYNRRRFFSIRDRDHGSLDQAAPRHSIKKWLEQEFAQAGFELEGRTYFAFFLPRVLGYVFNPISVFYSYDADGELDGILYEVHNTFGERHVYVMPVIDTSMPSIKQTVDKAFYVSPFFNVEGQYHFRTSAPDERLQLVIDYDLKGTRRFSASVSGARAPLSDRSLLINALRMPFTTAKVTLAIHYQAFRLWLKRVPPTLKSKPAPPRGPSYGQRTYNDEKVVR